MLKGEIERMVKNIIFDLGNVIIRGSSIETLMHFTDDENKAKDLLENGVDIVGTDFLN